ncbi:hypothetical protein SPRG_14034 [Saprolegnia parasitica CBS 223.65]|uniref:Secreted protein n=1 Tax=Saprolegnia parasitica (strain CBS 223.65) TaxID=695850 RepID=A0A067BRQ8_SAPPC|nr:hypothetical protein SPRG_14034 [Saprolegnia parasitica CBS 223.65]KDO20943.1 hypothetical protein SPRG_14034 [Saprolegnia parasitica CBS 223.65]|eukprot:XP_012208335.1 hypothetical protein SPRG_14034 [Saprolegnia parasitica CBS 223.65]
MKTCLLASTAYIAVATAASCTHEVRAVWYANAFQAVESNFASCAKDANVSLSTLKAGAVKNATQEMVDNLTKSPNCVAVFTSVHAASNAVLPPCLIGTMCGISATTSQFGALSYDQFVHVLLRTSKCTIPDDPLSAAPGIPSLPPSATASVPSSASTLGLGVVATGTLALALLY